jgi:lambda family phage portal protein
LEPGVTVDLAPGEDIKFSEPVEVGGSYEPFQYRQLLRAAAGAGIPYSDMTGDLRRTSFGSIRAGLIAHRRRIETLQQSVIVYQLCQRVYDRWWTEAVLAGALPVTPSQFAANQKAYRRADWIPPKWDWIDPLKDIEAEQLLVQNGFRSRSDVIKGMGGDPLVVDMQRKQDLEREAALGLPQSIAQPPPVPTDPGGPSAKISPVDPPRVSIRKHISTTRDADGNLTATITEEAMPA